MDDTILFGGRKIPGYIQDVLDKVAKNPHNIIMEYRAGPGKAIYDYYNTLFNEQQPTGESIMLNCNVRLCDANLLKIHTNTKGDFQLLGPWSDKVYTFITLNDNYKVGEYVLCCVRDSKLTMGVICSLRPVTDKRAAQTALISDYWKPLIGKINKEELTAYFKLRHSYNKHLIKQRKSPEEMALEQAADTLREASMTKDSEVARGINTILANF